MRVAILDDYLDSAMTLADWSPLDGRAKVDVFREHIASRELVAEKLADYEVVVAMRERTPFPKALLEKLPKLKLLITTGMRNLSFDMAAAEAQGVTVCGTRGQATPTAELTWGLIHALMRDIPGQDRSMKSGGWQTWVGHTLQGKTLGVVGLGRLGEQVATVGLAFGMKVVAWSQNLTEERCKEVGARRVEKDELLASADIVSIHVVLSDRSRGLIGSRELGLMKRTAFLVNTSRGPIVDRDALLQTLREKKIQGAGIDVYDTEPLPSDDPLRQLDNVVLTPHVGYATQETYALMYGDAVEDITAFLDGKPLRVLNK